MRSCNWLLSLAGWLATSVAWPDCSTSDTAARGPFSDIGEFNATAEDGSLVFVTHPPLPGKSPYPVMVFSHGTTGEYAMYEHAIQTYASHGFVVIFPHVKSPTEDVKPLTLDPHGKFAIKGVHFATAANSNESSQLHNMLDLKNLVLAGHSMGATTTIMAAQKLPAGTAKVAIAQHPGICGPFGPPPCLGPGPLCNTWMPSDFRDVSAKMPVLLTTATNDGAFWPAPHTAEHELGCFHESTDASDKSAKAASTAFAQFSATVCADDGTGGRYDRKWSNGGHDCPMLPHSPETTWVLVAAKLYAQLAGDPASTCHKMLWGNQSSSLQKDPAVEKFVINSPSASADNFLLSV